MGRIGTFPLQLGLCFSCSPLLKKGMEKTTENVIGETAVLVTEPQFSFVIPAYNEVGRIETMLKDLLSSLDYQSKFNGNYELLIIMDGCEDGTPETVNGLIKDHPGVTALVLPDRLGKGGAIIEALKFAKGDLVAFIDADGSIPTSELNKLIGLAEDYDLVIGSRYEKSSVLPFRRPISRLIFSRSFNVLIKLMFWKLHGIKDTQCGVKVFTKRLIEEINGDFLITDFAFDVNLIYSAVRHGFKYKEVGITWIEKDGGKLSGSLTKQIIVMAFSVFKLRLHYSALKGWLDSRLYKEFAKVFYSRSKS